VTPGTGSKVKSEGAEDTELQSDGWSCGGRNKPSAARYPEHSDVRLAVAGIIAGNRNVSRSAPYMFRVARRGCLNVPFTVRRTQHRYISFTVAVKVHGMHTVSGKN